MDSSKRSSAPISDVAAKLFRQMGGALDKGLGKNNQGIVEPVSLEGGISRHGFGHVGRQNAIFDPNRVWDDSVEQKAATETPLFISCHASLRDKISDEFAESWIVVGKPLDTLRTSVNFCDEVLLNDVIDAKSVFDHLDGRVLQEARKRANPYETVMGGMFQNRAAMKTANLDKVFGWKLSEEFDDKKRFSKNPTDPSEDPVNTGRGDEIFYFADVCAGPGGFSEYMLWRKGFYNAKGFGFTLRGGDDFKLNNFRAGSAAFFETFYGTNMDGDVTHPENLRSLEEFVKKRTNEIGCNLVMCDGGFSVDGKEEIQEILSKRLYLCQFIVGLSLCRVSDGSRKGGNFVCKLFDVFTNFSAGLIYLMYTAFDSISLHKPNTSRPANSERYIFCEGLTQFGAVVIKNYFVELNNRLHTLPKNSDILEIVPIESVEDCSEFFNYFKSNNEEFARRQVVYLNKYREFALNKGAFDIDQHNLREECLKYWEIPDRLRDKDRLSQPASVCLRSLLGKASVDFERFSKFSLSILSTNVEKHLRMSELSSTLIPEFGNPVLLVTNNIGVAHLAKGNESRRLDDLLLPPRTLMLVYETYLYGSDLNNLSRCLDYSKLLYIVDAAFINGDNISELDYDERVRLIRKFCTVSNRGLESIACAQSAVTKFGRSRQFQTYYMHCTDNYSLLALVDTVRNIKLGFDSEKQTTVAVVPFEFPKCIMNQPNVLYLPCKGIRFVSRYNDQFLLCWSSTNHRTYFFNKRNGSSESPLPEPYATFQDHLNVEKQCSWIWNWKKDSDTRHNIGPREILLGYKDDDSILTFPTFSNAVSELYQKYQNITS